VSSWPGTEFTGWHKIEKDLWVSGLQPDSSAIADQLLKGKHRGFFLGRYKAIYEETGLPLILFQYPDATKATYNLDTQLEIAAQPGVFATKNGVRNMRRWYTEIPALREAYPDLQILSCHDEYLLHTMFDVDGLLVGYGNMAPEPLIELIAAGKAQDYPKAHEIHDKLEGEEGHASSKVAASFASVIVQIMLLDIVFSLDSVITAVGMVDELYVNGAENHVPLEPEELRAHVPQALGLELQADDEEQEHHAELGERPDMVHRVHQLEAPGADGDAGQQPGVEEQGHQQERHRPRADPGDRPPGLIGDDADPGEHKPGGGHQRAARQRAERGRAVDQQLVHAVDAAEDRLGRAGQGALLRDMADEHGRVEAVLLDGDLVDPAGDLDLLHAGAHRLAVGDLRAADVRVDVELAREPVDDDLEVQLAHP
jgi:hypothetical protein